MVQYQQKKLHDNKWHTIVAEKQSNFLRLTVDNDPPEKARFAGNDEFANTNPLIYIGGLPPGMPLALGQHLSMPCFLPTTKYSPFIL